MLLLGTTRKRRKVSQVIALLVPGMSAERGDSAIWSEWCPTDDSEVSVLDGP